MKKVHKKRYKEEFLKADTLCGNDFYLYTDRETKKSKTWKDVTCKTCIKLRDR